MHDHGIMKELYRPGVAGLERGEDRAEVKQKPRQRPDLGEIQETGKKSRLPSRENGRHPRV